MIENVPISDVVKNLYSILLSRTPNDEEIAPYLDAYLNGISLEQLSLSIANSDEAKQRLSRQALDILATRDFDGVKCERAVEISAEDLMYTLAQTYETFIGRAPWFSEVARRFKAIVNGASLTGEIAAISLSDEATSHQSKKQILDNRHSTFDTKEGFSKYIQSVYNRCLQRNISPGEIDTWYSHYSTGLTYRDIFLSIDNCEEAISKRDGGLLTEWQPALFVQLLCEVVLGHGATPTDIIHYQKLIDEGAISRQNLLNSFFVHTARIATKSAEAPAANNPSEAYLFGKRQPVTIAQWREREAKLHVEPAPAAPTFSHFVLTSDKKPLVSIITSLFKGGRFIDTFLENITSQSIFEKHCELLIIDANSPDGEHVKAAAFLRRFPNIKYIRCPYKIGIYEAWNMAISKAQGLYLTNANLDDCRRQDSLEIQAATLDAVNFADIVYQDVLYSFDENMPFSDIQSFGFKTDLPIISRYNLLEFNSPHNGPMWRKSLHDDVGLFNGEYRSAGDAEFWIRCHLAGKNFYKINDPHVAYYNNPQGLSTRSDTPGAAESRRISRTFNRALISPDLTMTDTSFNEKLSSLVGEPIKGASRYAMVQTALRKISATSRSMIEGGH